LLAILLLVMIQILMKLSRLDRRLNQSNQSEESRNSVSSSEESSSRGGFEIFLNEDPVRRKLTKSEQFNAYRIWRQERGMNWSKS
jgi:hypothetical protein